MEMRIWDLVNVAGGGTAEMNPWAIQVLTEGLPGGMDETSAANATIEVGTGETVIPPADSKVTVRAKTSTPTGLVQEGTCAHQSIDD